MHLKKRLVLGSWCWCQAFLLVVPIVRAVEGFFPSFPLYHPFYLLCQQSDIELSLCAEAGPGFPEFEPEGLFPALLVLPVYAQDESSEWLSLSSISLSNKCGKSG